MLKPNSIKLVDKLGKNNLELAESIVRIQLLGTASYKGTKYTVSAITKRKNICLWGKVLTPNGNKEVDLVVYQLPLYFLKIKAVGTENWTSEVLISANYTDLKNAWDLLKNNLPLDVSDIDGFFEMHHYPVASSFDEKISSAIINEGRRRGQVARHGSFECILDKVCDIDAMMNEDTAATKDK